MAPKNDIWKRMPKWRLKLWKGKKPPPVIARPHFSPTLPNQDRRDLIDQSVVWLCVATPAGYDTFVPVVNLRVHQGSHCLLFESTLLRERALWLQRLELDEPPVTTYSLRFPGERGVVALPREAMRESIFDADNERIRLTAISYDTDETKCPAISFGQMVVEGQRVFFYDLRHGLPSLVEANVACVTEEAFLLDAKWCESFLMGSLVFDDTNSLVGVVCHHAGSPIAMHVDRITQLLFTFFPQMEMHNMADFHHELQQQILAPLPPLHARLW